MYQCPLCYSENLQRYIQTRDYFLTAEKFAVMDCKECGHLFTSPQPPVENISKYYQSDSYLSHSEKPASLIAKLYDWVRWINLRTKFNQVSRNAHNGPALDYGCGRGDFVKFAQRKGWDAFGIEQDADARSFAKQQTNGNVFAPEEENHSLPEKFSVITMFHVLEHLYDLPASMQKFSNWLDQDGILAIALPNPLSFDAKYYGEHWAAWDVPRHLHHFRKATIINVSKQYGLTLTKIYPMYWDAFFVAMLSEQYKNSRFGKLRAFAIGLASNISAIKTGQYSSLLYIFRKSV